MRSRQQTIVREVSLDGVGLHTGEEARASLRPAPPGTGVTFRRTDVRDSPTLTVRDAREDSPTGRTALERDGVSIHTVEHLLAALMAAGLDNVEVLVEGPELPGKDGSAAAWAGAVMEAGIDEQDAPLEAYVVESPLVVRGGNASLVAVPGAPGELRVSYSLYYRESRLARGYNSFVVTPESFAEEIAAARTFCMAGEVERLLALGLGRGASRENTLVLEENSVRGTTLRFPDEPLRHKVLDLLGDLALLGSPLSAHILGSRSGHTLNRLLVRKIIRTCRKVPAEGLRPIERAPGSGPPGPVYRATAASFVLPVPVSVPAPAPPPGAEGAAAAAVPAPAPPQGAEGSAPDGTEGAGSEPLSTEEIMEVLPHRYPFLLIDRILEFERGKRVVAVKNLTRSEPFFRGHFPGRPVVPGVLQVEAMAQAAGLILGRTDMLRDRVGLLAGIEKLRLRRPLLPGDRMLLTVTLDRMRGPFAMVSGRIEVEGEIAAEGQIRFAVMEPETLSRGTEAPPAAGRSRGSAGPGTS